MFNVGGIDCLSCAYLIFLVCTWRTIPGEISTHFGALGQADATGSKMILPILVLMEMFLFFFQMVLSLIPGIINQNPKALEKKSGSIYYHIRSFFCILTLITNVIFGYIIIQIARQKSPGLMVFAGCDHWRDSTHYLLCGENCTGWEIKRFFPNSLLIFSWKLIIITVLQISGGIAQLGERLNGIQEVMG